MRPLIVVILTALGASAAYAQAVPHDFKQDTPPAPGQVIERPRDMLRIAPLPLRGVRNDELGLPPGGPMGRVRESYNEPVYNPPQDR